MQHAGTDRGGKASVAKAVRTTDAAGEGKGVMLRSAPGGPALRFIDTEGPLKPLVETYYLYRWDAREVEGVERVDVGQIRFMLKGEGVLLFPDGREEHSRPVMINAPGTAAARYRVEGPFHCFGVSLRPIGWRSLVRLPAHQVADRVIDGAEVFGPEVIALLAELRRLETLEEMIAAVEPFLQARRQSVPVSHLALAQAVREWSASETLDVQALYDAVPGMTPRQVMRLCNEYFGGSPTHLRRKFRALLAALRLYRGERAADVAAPFSDQSHMINEVKHYTGHTPTSLRERIDPVLAATLDKETFYMLPEAVPETLDPHDD